jgi:ADP-ribose pyrophosphatase YjhB (NUDIX family)
MTHIHEKIDWTVDVYIIRDGKVLFIKHKQMGMWLPIGGHIELDEDPEQALYREVKEECDLEIELIGSSKPNLNDTRSKPLPTPAFLDIHTISPTHRHTSLVYFARAKPGNPKLAEKEHDEIRWFSRADMVDAKFNIAPAIRFYAEQALKMDEYIEKSKRF